LEVGKSVVDGWRYLIAFGEWYLNSFRSLNFGLGVIKISYDLIIFQMERLIVGVDGYAVAIVIRK
jgi:hypothetical protein